MRIAIFSDVHANLVALDAVLGDIQRRDVEQMVCLGDVAASGPQPHETIQRLIGLHIPIVMGNADAWLLDPQPYSGENALYRKVSEIDTWCASQLTEEDFNFLRTFQATVEIPLTGEGSLLCYHGSPYSNTDVIAAGIPDDDLEPLLSGFQALAMSGGHTHVQMLRRYRASILVNPGSVGLGYELEKSGDTSHNVPWAEYAILDWAAGSLSVIFRRVPLDLTLVRQGALQSDMPHAAWWVGEWRA